MTLLTAASKKIGRRITGPSLSKFDDKENNDKDEERKSLSSESDQPYRVNDLDDDDEEMKSEIDQDGMKFIDVNMDDEGK